MSGLANTTAISILSAVTISIVALGSPGVLEAQQPPGTEDPPRVEDDRDADAPDPNWLNLRAGGSANGASGRPVLCGEVTIWDPVSVESCGTWSGVLHQDEDAQIAHFRGKIRVLRWALRPGFLTVHASAGFAEVQVGADDEPGFKFGRPTRDEPVETAGPEAGFAVRFQLPWAYGFEFIADANLGAAWLEHGPRLIEPHPRLLPFGELTVGLGW